MKVIQIKGSNGSGKTTIAKQLIELSNNPVELKDDEGVYATYMDDIGYAILGAYPETSKMGGCDNMKSVARIKAALLKTVDYCIEGDVWVVFEGMMISTIKSTFYDYLLELRESHDIEPMFVILRTDVDSCVERIKGRGTMRAKLNINNIDTKCRMILRHAKEYDVSLVRYLNVDEIPLDRMMAEFVHLVGDIEMMELISD